MSIWPYISNKKLAIDGRMIPYPLVTAADYLEARFGMKESEIEDFIDSHYEQYTMLNAIIAMKQSCFLLRHTEYSCGSLSDNLYAHKNDMVVKYNETYDEPFDEDFYEDFKEYISSAVEHLREVDMSDMRQPIAVIFEHPLDFPDKYVIRLFDMNNATNVIILKDSLDECRRECLYSNFLNPIPRDESDDSHIVESWML